MMRYLRYLLLAILALALITIAMANRSVVGLNLLPDGIAAFAGFNLSIRLPLFLVIFGGVVAGLALGYVMEWIREARQRAEGNRAKRDAKQLEREVKRLKRDRGENKDEVLALLEDRA